jgi:cytochrome c
MAEAVENSLQYLTSEDVSALVAYLRTVAAQKGDYEVNAAPAPGAQKPQDELGRHVFEGACVNCHQYNGEGRQTGYASLVGSRSVADPDGGNVTQIMLNGAKYRIEGQNIYMPPFGPAYSDAELAAVANYVIGHFGGKNGPRHAWGCRQAETGIAQEGDVFRLIFRPDPTMAKGKGPLLPRSKGQRKSRAGATCS